MKRFADGQELRRAREDKCLSLADLARISGVSKGSIGNFETGARGLGPKKHRAIYEALYADAQTIAGEYDSVAPVSCLEKHGKLAPREVMAARISDLERQLERANETIASQARTIEAMQQGRSHVAPVSGACGGDLQKASARHEKKVAG